MNSHEFDQRRSVDQLKIYFGSRRASAYLRKIFKTVLTIHLLSDMGSVFWDIKSTIHWYNYFASITMSSFGTLDTKMKKHS